MPRGRNRRSAADAVARPLALALALVSTLPRAAHSQDLAPPPLRPPGRRATTCDNVPEPFGISSRGASSLPGGFGVTCGPNREAILSIGEHEYRIDSVSVPGSYVVIFAEPITQVCYDGKGKPTPDTGTGAKSLDGTTFTWSLEGTPFTFSKSNKLVNFGCNRTLMANFNLSGDPSPLYTSCTTTCNTLNISGSCLGEACCEASTDQMNGVKAFSLSFERTTANGTGDGEEDETCSAAFFLGKAEPVFNFSGDGVRPLKKALSQQGERRMILDWAIGSTTCDQAQSYGLRATVQVRLRHLRRRAQRSGLSLQMPWTGTTEIRTSVTDAKTSTNAGTPIVTTAPIKTTAAILWEAIPVLAPTTILVTVTGQEQAAPPLL